MKVQFEPRNIQQGVNTVQHALTSATLPVLSHILVATTTDKVKLTATNLETTIQCEIPATVEEAGEICVAGEKLASIVRQLPAETLSWSTTETRIKLVCGRSRFSLMGLPAAEFPEYPEPAKVDFVIPEHLLQGMFQKTIFAVSKDQTRQNLSGVYLEGESGLLKMIATDGRRLAMVSAPLASLTEAVQVLIPLKAAQQLIRILGDGEDVQVGVAQNRVFFTTGWAVLVSQLIAAKFPDYRQVIPKESRTALTIDRNELLGAIRRCAVMSEEKSHLLRFSFKGEALALRSNEPELGEAYEEVAVTADKPVDTEVGFNAQYLVDALRVMTEEKVRLELIDSVSPGVLRGVRAEEPTEEGVREGGYTYVVMPIRIEEVSEEDNEGNDVVE